VTLQRKYERATYQSEAILLNGVQDCHNDSYGNDGAGSAGGRWGTRKERGEGTNIYHQCIVERTWKDTKRDSL